MRVFMDFSTSIALAFGAATAASAAECSGITSRVGEAPIEIMKSEDGATTMLIRSTGSVSDLKPTVLTAWQHCVGLWTAKPDGSGSGVGNCYRVDPDGDHEMIHWEARTARARGAPTRGPESTRAPLGRARGRPAPRWAQA